MVLRRQLDNYDGVSDVHLSSFHKTSNFGQRETMEFDRSNYVPLVRFAVFASDGGPVPDNATIDSARLFLYKGAYDNVIALHAILRPWVENQATWNQAQTGIPWAIAGATGSDTDYVSVPDAQVSAGINAGWIEFDVTQRLQAIRQGASNNGWRLISVSGNSNRKQIRSSEYVADQATRPRLEVDWRPPAN